jgi:hypothetical protein
VTDATVAPAPSFFAARRALFKILVIPAALVAILVSTLLLGATSRPLHTGSVLGLEMAATEQLVLQGIPSADVVVAATISNANGYWGRFLVAPSETRYTSKVDVGYGFAQWTRRTVTLPDHAGTVENYRWVVVADGEFDVGCPSKSAAPRVPLNVIQSFGLTCPAL